MRGYYATTLNSGRVVTFILVNNRDGDDPRLVDIKVDGIKNLTDASYQRLADRFEPETMCDEWEMPEPDYCPEEGDM